MKVITIGRSQDNDIVVNDVKVSRNHLQIVQDDNGNCSVVDLSSSNGTFVNGQRITGRIRLHPNDIVQIGNTKLPWQSYLNPIITNSVPEPAQKDKRIIWYVASAVVLLMLIGGAYLYISSNNKKKIEKQEQLRIAKENDLKEQYKQKLLEAENYTKEAENLYKKAITTGDAAYKKLADEKTKLSEEAAKEANTLDGEIKELQKQLEATKQQLDGEIKAKEAAIAKSEEDNKARAKADSIAQVEKTKAKAANTETINTKEELKLTTEFHDISLKLKSNNFKKVREELGLKLPNGKKEEEVIREHFNKVDNAQKQKIIAAVKKALGQQSKDEEVEKTKSDSIKQ